MAGGEYAVELILQDFAQDQGFRAEAERWENCEFASAHLPSKVIIEVFFPARVVGFLSGDCHGWVEEGLDFIGLTRSELSHFLSG